VTPLEQTQVRPPGHRPVHRPVGELRRLVFFRRWLRRVGIAAAALVTLVVGQLILNTEPDRHDTAAPFFVSGELNKPVTVEGLTVTVLGVKGAAKIDPPDALPADTGGIWIVVQLRLEATTKPLSPTYAGLAAPDGRSFQATARFRQSLVGGAVKLQPGIPMSGDLAFEVPKDAAAAGLHIQVGLKTGGGTVLAPWRAYADIALPIGDADVARWQAQTQPLAINEPKLGD
jgi:hypothetical protein